MYYNTLKDTLKARDRRAMLTLNARLIEQVEALQSELLQRGLRAVMTSAECAEVYGIDDSTVRQAIRRGTIPARQSGATWPNG